MPHPVHTQTMVVVIKEYNDSAAEGRVPVFGRWQEARDEAQDVAEEDEEGQRADKREVASAVIANQATHRVVETLQAVFDEVADRELSVWYDIARFSGPGP